MSQLNISDSRRGAAITVKVIPRARRTELAGLMDDGTLKIRVAAPPVDGAANKALVDYLAAIMGLHKSQVDIVAGETSERKLVGLVGISPQQVEQIVRKLLKDDD
jgi:uncharacterized protein